MKRILIIILFFTSLLSIHNIKASNACILDSVHNIKNRIENCKRAEVIDISKDLNLLIEIYANEYSTNSSQYADCLLWCAMQCAKVGDLKTSKQLLDASTNVFFKYGNGRYLGRDTIHEILRLDIETLIAQKTGQEYIKIKRQEQSVLLKKEYFKNNSIYLKSLLDLSQSYAERQRYVKSQNYHSLAYSAYVNLIEQELCTLCESERRSYWNIASQYIYKTLDVANTYSKQNVFQIGNRITSDAYNAILLSKGILLNSTRSFEDFILSSNNLKALDYLFERKEQQSTSASQEVLDSLDYIILEELKSQGQAYTLPYLSYTWKDVCSQLGEKDIAIEFYRTLKGDYGVMCVKRNWKFPRVVALKDLSKSDMLWACNNLLQEAQTDSTKIYQELRQITRDVWPHKLTKYFPKKDDGNIYFSADGELLIKSIEYLPTCKYHGKTKEYKHHTCMHDIYNLYRLSSTRELINNKDELKSNSIKAAIYGGLSYAMDTASMINNQKKYPEAIIYQKSQILAQRDLALDSLPGSRIEAKKIKELIQDLDSTTHDANLYEGDEGTEASFKSQGGKGNTLIHVATHGFFEKYPDKRTDPLLQCGLLMSGANHKVFNRTIPQGIDDGILTALEISILNFRGLDLITLSACETGLGRIDLDGVFGLQRGLKMADANSILMSLWKVDDEATCALMIDFYSHWLSGKSKHEALRSAVDNLRANPKWASPKYWAAFILLDGIN